MYNGTKLYTQLAISSAKLDGDCASEWDVGCTWVIFIIINFFKVLQIILSPAHNKSKLKIQYVKDSQFSNQKLNLRKRKNVLLLSLIAKSIYRDIWIFNSKKLHTDKFNRLSAITIRDLLSSFCG